MPGKRTNVIRIDKSSTKLTQVRRVDYMPFEDDGPDGSWMVEKMELTDEGYLGFCWCGFCRTRENVYIGEPK